MYPMKGSLLSACLSQGLFLTLNLYTLASLTPSCTTAAVSKTTRHDAGCSLSDDPCSRCAQIREIWADHETELFLDTVTSDTMMTVFT